MKPNTIVILTSNDVKHNNTDDIGLDVHDVGLYSRSFEAGMVLTCEPGIYIFLKKA
ncbi:M24 family metallopeptidase [uncultured Algibacter sp.]|uniref:M24 family metallopeptidase n=1 Tax=uncultured Algibacter sp. TaxID=298659 RepID=UPI002607CBA1|nr:M24 family metallopeptidase [uncultured Algibacter sp.]